MSTTSDRSRALLTDNLGLDDVDHVPVSVVARVKAKSPRLIVPLLITVVVLAVLVIALAIVVMFHSSIFPSSPPPSSDSSSSSSSSSTGGWALSSTPAAASSSTAAPHSSTAGSLMTSSPPILPATTNLSALLTAESVYTHLVGLQRAADTGNATRRTDTLGYNASLAYVQSVLQTLPSLIWTLQPWQLGQTRGTNVMASTVAGDPTATITAGAHLDAVYSGMNDNGSGSAALLALAVAVDSAIRAGQLKLTNRIRFHWYDKEESGLMGSRAAVALLINGTGTGERLVDHVAQLNMDMVGSSNWIMGVLDCSLTGANSSRAGSAVLASMFKAEYQARGWPYRTITSTRYTGGSDQYSYLAQGIPASILFTGVTEVHSEDDVRDFGGVLGLPADACYHRTCDTILNVSPIILSRVASMYAVVLQSLAMDGDVRETLHVGSGGEGLLMELAPSITDVRRQEAALAGVEFVEDDVFLW